MAIEDIHAAGGEARRGDHRQAEDVVGGLGGERDLRPRPRLADRDASGVVLRVSGREFVSMGVITDGKKYGIKEELCFSLPCVCRDGNVQVVEGLKWDKF